MVGTVADIGAGRCSERIRVEVMEGVGIRGWLEARSICIVKMLIRGGASILNRLRGETCVESLETKSGL